MFLLVINFLAMTRVILYDLFIYGFKNNFTSQLSFLIVHFTNPYGRPIWLTLFKYVRNMYDYDITAYYMRGVHII